MNTPIKIKIRKLLEKNNLLEHLHLFDYIEKCPECSNECIFDVKERVKFVDIFLCKNIYHMGVEITTRHLFFIRNIVINEKTYHLDFWPKSKVINFKHLSFDFDISESVISPKSYLTKSTKDLLPILEKVLLLQ